MRTWFSIGIILILVAALGYSRMEIKSLKAESTLSKVINNLALDKAKNEVWDKQQEIDIKSDSIKDSKVEAIRRLADLASKYDFKLKNLESDLSIQKHWVDSLQELADRGTFLPLNPKDTNKVNPLGRILVSKQVVCWGMKGEIITRDPNAYLNILEKNSSDWIDLLVFKQKRFLGFLWITKYSSYQIKNDCGEMIIRNIKIQ